jgi:hypothetical protein
MWWYRSPMSGNVIDRRSLLLRTTKWLMTLMAIAILFVVFDYTIDFRPAQIHSSYRFKLSQVPVDTVVFLNQDNLSIVLIRRSEQLLKDLVRQENKLQDPDSGASRQPEFARNKFRAKHKKYFVAYAMGTDFGCPLEANAQFSLSESCGTATYDFAGRAISGENRFQNLTIPDYNFNHDFSILTIFP